MLAADLEQVHVTWLEGLGTSYRMKGFFTIRVPNELLKVNFKGVAFGGNYGGHNVSVQISEVAKRKVISVKHCTTADLDDLLTEVQRRLLNNEMVVEFDRIRPDSEIDTPL